MVASYSAQVCHAVTLMALQHYYPWSLGLKSFLKPSQLPGEYTVCAPNICKLINHKNQLCPHRYPFTPGWREAYGDVNNHLDISLCILHRHAPVVIHFSPIKRGTESSRNNAPLLPYPVPELLLSVCYTNVADKTGCTIVYHCIWVFG